MLSFFFDGVPDYSKKKAQTTVDSVHKKNNNWLLASLPLKSTSPSYIYHKPYTDRNCLACHDKGVNNTSLREQPEMCYACHKDYSTVYKYLHGPVGGGYCNACHNPHKATQADLLKSKGQALCLYCHVSESVFKNQAHQGTGTTDCTHCHNPHGGDTQYVLK